MRAQTELNSFAESKVTLSVAPKVEALRVRELPLIVIGTAKERAHVASLRELRARDLRIVLNDRELIRVADQRGDRIPDEVGGGLVAHDEQQDDELHHSLRIERIVVAWMVNGLFQ